MAEAVPHVAEWPTEDDGQGEEAATALPVDPPPPAVEPAPMEEDDDEWVDWPPVEPPESPRRLRRPRPVVIIRS